MTAPQQSPGGQREDTALAVGAAVGVAMAAASSAAMGLLGPALRKVLAGGNPRAIGRRLHVEAAAILTAAVQHAEAVLDEAEKTIVEQATDTLNATVPVRQSGPFSAPTRLPGKPTPRAAAPKRLALPAGTSPAPNLTTVAEAVRDAGLNALREEDDVFRVAAQAATANHATGTQAAQKMLDDLASRGVTVFVDKAGRHWDLAAYCEMAVRTAASRLALLTQLHLMGPVGMDLVVVDAPSGEQGCRKCAPFEGRVLSLSGATMTGAWVSVVDAFGRRKSANVTASLSEAVAAGLLHPNCRHALVPFTDGAASLPLVGGPRGFVQHGNPIYRGVIPDVEGRSYRAQQKQRALEREVRAAVARQSVALTPLARAKARRELAAARSNLTEHVESYHLTRQRYRENPAKAR